MLIAALALTCAYFWGKHALWIYAALLVLGLQGRVLLFFLGAPIRLLLSMINGYFHGIDLTVTLCLLLLIATPFFIWQSAKWKGRYGKKALIILWSVACVIILFSVLMMYLDIRASQLARDAIVASGQVPGI